MITKVDTWQLSTCHPAPGWWCVWCNWSIGCCMLDALMFHVDVDVDVDVDVVYVDVHVSSQCRNERGKYHCNRNLQLSLCLRLCLCLFSPLPPGASSFAKCELICVYVLMKVPLVRTTNSFKFALWSSTRVIFCKFKTRVFTLHSHRHSCQV